MVNGLRKRAVLLFRQCCQQNTRISPVILVLSGLLCIGNSEFGMAQPSPSIRSHEDIVAAVRALSDEIPNATSAMAGLRDPTRPPSEGAVASATYSRTTSVKRGGGVLSTIIFSPHRKLAIINDQIVRVGDKVGSMEILSINAKSVEVRDERRSGKQFTLTVHEHFPIKIPVQQ